MSRSFIYVLVFNHIYTEMYTHTHTHGNNPSVTPHYSIPEAITHTPHTHIHTHTLSEDGDESSAAVPLCKLFSQTASTLVGGAASSDPAAVEERLSADTEDQLGPVHSPKVHR